MGVLSIQHVNYIYQTQYQKVEALRDISADFDAGKVYALSLIHISEPTRH